MKISLFYQAGSLVSVMAAHEFLTIFRAGTNIFSERKLGGQHEVTLSSVDASQSVIGALDSTKKQAVRKLNYTPYGFERVTSVELPYVRYVGELFDSGLEGYLLGAGYRLYNPALLRFVSADSCSPFYEGGVNAYAYCMDDPVNNHDPDGHQLSPNIQKSLQSWAATARKRVAIESAVVEARAHQRVSMGLRGGGENMPPRLKARIYTRAREVHKGHRSAVEKLSPNQISKYLDDHPGSSFSVDYQSRMTALKALNNRTRVPSNLGMTVTVAALVNAVLDQNNMKLRVQVARVFVSVISAMRKGNFEEVNQSVTTLFMNANRGRPIDLVPGEI